jgi:hypothetical protein
MLTGRGGEAHVSQATRVAIDTEVKRLTSQAYLNAKNLLTQHQDKLHLLAQELMKEETLSGEQVRALVAVTPLKHTPSASAKSLLHAAAAEPGGEGGVVSGADKAGDSGDSGGAPDKLGDKVAEKQAEKKQGGEKNKTSWFGSK